MNEKLEAELIAAFRKLSDSNQQATVDFVTGFSAKNNKDKPKFRTRRTKADVPMISIQVEP